MLTGRPTATTAQGHSSSVEVNSTAPALLPVAPYLAPTVAPTVHGPPATMTAQSLAAQLLSSFIAPRHPPTSPHSPALQPGSKAPPHSSAKRVLQTAMIMETAQAALPSAAQTAAESVSQLLPQFPKLARNLRSTLSSILPSTFQSPVGRWQLGQQHRKGRWLLGQLSPPHQQQSQL